MEEKKGKTGTENHCMTSGLQKEGQKEDKFSIENQIWYTGQQMMAGEVCFLAAWAAFTARTATPALQA